MKSSLSRRQFIRTAAIGIGVAGEVPALSQSLTAKYPLIENAAEIAGYGAFVPVRAASWWCNLEDILWPQKKIVDKIKYRAEAFSKARIDTAINFGFHIRFDFSNYFGQLHGYYANVCEELHKYDIKFLDHYSCNHVERPRGVDELKKLHKNQRHHVLLFHDPVSADYAQYEGHYFKDLCQINLLDGTRGYAKQYQMEAFCHNNPGFLDMHKKYLYRLIKEVSFDGIQVDDMCNYAGLITCGCIYCREKFLKDWGQRIPDFNDFEFWGETKGKNEFTWGNYDNPVFKDWLRMRADSVADHLKMVKNIVGDRPLMTCCSSSGPIALNSISLDLERMSPYLDFFMLENCGINVDSVNWIRTDPEALNQKDIAAKRGNAVPMALSYTIYDRGGYLGWSLSRFWGVANWSSTLNQGLEEDPGGLPEIEDIIGRYNNWELKYSNLDYREGKDLVEVRLANSRYCRENGWIGTDGLEQWQKVEAWSAHLVKSNVGYKFVRCDELSDEDALCRDRIPLILDGLGCVSDSQIKAIKTYLSKGGTVWLAPPFATHDEKGLGRNTDITGMLLSHRYRNLYIIDSATVANPLENLIQNGRFRPVLKQISGDNRWIARIRFYSGNPVIHFMNSGLVAVPHPEISDTAGVHILKDIESAIHDNNLTYEINTDKVPVSSLLIMSPELGEKHRTVNISGSVKGKSVINVNLEGITIYSVVCNV